MTYNMQEAVDKGAAFLDLVNPGWHHKINLDKLFLSSCFDCVLGQLYGEEAKSVKGTSDGYYYACDVKFKDVLTSYYYQQLGEVVDNQINYGFMAPGKSWALEDEWKELTQTWKTTILAKREAENFVQPTEIPSKAG